MKDQDEYIMTNFMNYEYLYELTNLKKSTSVAQRNEDILITVNIIGK